MKKYLLLAVLVFSSLSFAQQSYTMTLDADQVTAKKLDRSYPITATQRNADFLCLAKGFHSALGFETREAGMYGMQAKEILPDGSVYSFEKNSSGGEVITKVNCTIKIEDR